MVVLVDKMPHSGCENVIEYVFTRMESHIGINKPGKLCAVLDLAKNNNNYLMRLDARKRRKLKKCEQYKFEEFNMKTFMPDIVEINRSKSIRSGGPMKPHYLVSVEEKGGYPVKYHNPELHSCKIHSLNNVFGVFASMPGYCQGDIVTNKKLLAYCVMHMAGNFIMYSMIIGHGDYLKYAIMTRLHLGIMQWITNYPKLKWLLYSGWTDGGDGSGLQTWKKEHLFEPIYLQQ